VNVKSGITHIGVGVGVIIVNEGRILLMQRGSESKKDKFKWDIPGGAVEYGETMLQAVHRETLEETGLMLSTCIPIGAIDDITVYDGIRVHWVANVYVATSAGVPKVMEPTKHINIQYFTIEEIPKEIATTIPACLRLYNNYNDTKI
jgi:ADP-ribose pyrophosphatase YjhB (NUDIX family)